MNKKAVKLHFTIFLFCFSSIVMAKEFEVVNEFMNVKTGAGRGYPVFTVVEKGESFQVLKSKKDWLKITTSSGSQGWVSYQSFYKSVKLSDYNNRKRNLKANWLVGGGFGKFGENNSYSLDFGYYLVPNVVVIAEAKKSINEYSSRTIFSADIGLQMFRLSVMNAFLNVGSGVLVYEPRESLVGVNTSQQTVVSYGGGFSFNPHEKLSLRLALKNYYLNADGENRLSWQLGFYSSFR